MRKATDSIIIYCYVYELHTLRSSTHMMEGSASYESSIIIDDRVLEVI
jgi:hypothetical protein